MAYVSGDLQGSAEDNWVWQGSMPDTPTRDPHANARRDLTPPGRIPSIAIPTPRFGDLPTPRLGTLSSDEASSWGGWDQVLWRLQLLSQERPSQGRGHTFGPGPGYEPPPRHVSAPPSGTLPPLLPPHQRPPLPVTTNTTPTSRISIASIM